MNSKNIFILILAVLFTCMVNYSYAGSIWAKKNKAVKTAYTDDVARKIGDVVTIIIAETSTIDNKAKRDLSKTASRSTDFNGDLGITTDNHNILPRMPGFTMSAESSNSMNGKADYKDDRSFSDLITAVVIDIMPNGNLVVVGTRSRDIVGDIQTIEVSGIVRPSDILFNNTIKSEQVANFSIITRNKGIAAPYNKPGWLGGFFDFVWPF